MPTRQRCQSIRAAFLPIVRLTAIAAPAHSLPQRRVGHRSAGASLPPKWEKAGRALISGEITAMIGIPVKRFCRRLDAVRLGSAQSPRSGARQGADAGRTMNDQSAPDRRNEMSAADVLLGALR